MNAVPASGSQQFDAPLTAHAVFVVLSLVDDADPGQVAEVLSDVPELLKSVRFRDASGSLTCTVAIGAARWTALTGMTLPAELVPFTPVVGAVHTAVSTPGDILLHIRGDRADLCFELERIVLDRLRPHTRLEDEVTGFRYFDRRDLLGFVDGTANPVGDNFATAVLVGDEDPMFAGGSYVVVQKYRHPLEHWNALPTHVQEAIIGRSKADDIEADDATHGQKSHKTLATIVDADGVEHDIVRDNMPFGSPGTAEFGTYFIGYARHLWVIDRMLERMFIGSPRGQHDRLLDFSIPLTGTAFFAPSEGLLSAIAQPAPTVAAHADTPSNHLSPATGASLGIGDNRTPTKAHRS